MNLPVPAEQYDEEMTGLEDFDPASASMPRIGIRHADGVFVDQLSGEEFAVIYGIPLGLVKQRIMWLKTMEDNSKPQCKSSDAITGYPNVQGDPQFQFPWVDANIAPSSAEPDEYDRPTLACATCPFSQWIRGSNGKNTPPRCSERYTFPLRYATEPDKPFLQSGLVSFKGSGITPWNKFVSPFVRNRTPLYTAIAEIKLNRNSRGQVVYSVPSIRKIGVTEAEDWPAYALDYRTTRDFLRRPPRANDDGSDPEKKQTAAGNVAASVVEAQVVIPNTSVSAPTPTSAPAPVIDDDEELPF